MIFTIIKEFGILWCINRTLYFAKIKILQKLPFLKCLFENNVQISRVNIFNFDVNNIEQFISALPETDKNLIIDIADKAIDGKILAFSSVELDYGNPISWHYNPITKAKIQNNIRWWEIPDFSEELGDIKIIWEASRLTHFIYFARAYLITKDKKYYNAFSSELEHWLRGNKYGYGANYKCGQECALRMISALFAYSVFGVHITYSDEFNMKQLVQESYKKISSNFFYAHKCIKNNHTFSEVCGLIIGAWCENNNIKLVNSYKLLNEIILEQFSKDGLYLQYSFNYQRFSLQIIECVMKISEQTGVEISQEAKSRVSKSILLLYQCQDDDGRVPNYGSNDGSLIFPVSACNYSDFRPMLNSLYLSISNERLYPPGNYDEEWCWFGSNLSKEYEIETECRKSSAFSIGGLYTIRRNSGFIMICLNDYQSRPTHMDGLHIDLWHKNVNILCDSGTYSYASQVGQYLAGTQGHNTAYVNNTQQMDRHSNFLVYNRYATNNITYDEISFSGSLISQKGYIHTREVELCEHGYIITDKIKLKNCSSGVCELLFHTPCSTRVYERGWEFSYDDVVMGTIDIAYFDGLGDFNINSQCTDVSNYYMLKSKATVVSVKCMFEKEFSIRFVIRLN